MRPLQLASKLSSLPLIDRISPASSPHPSREELESYRQCQSLAQQGAREIAAMIREGWSEDQAARLLNTWLADHGVHSYFHRAFAWFGDRTRFEGIRGYRDFLPSSRVIRPGDVFILDVAPIHRGYMCDIGYTSALGPNAELERAQTFLAELRADLPGLFATGLTGADITEQVNERMRAQGYDPIHSRYPFAVLGHRVHRLRAERPNFSFINFGWQSYWAFLSRGLFGQLLNDNYIGSLAGLWAIEPHVGGVGFGAKFEEILVVDEAGARWLSDESLTAS